MKTSEFCRSVRRPLAVCVASLSALATAEPIGDIVVTASRTPETVNESLASVSVITREDIQRSAARSLPDLLVRLPGVAMTNAGGLGKQSSLYVRGTENDHTLVLVDGVRLSAATSGTAALQFIPLSQIDRIEVVRGPRSSLYGGEALGGVIQIFTSGESARQRSEVVVGSNSTARLTQSFAHRDDTTRASLTASLLDTRGINAQKDSQLDRDGHDNKSVSASVDQQWSTQWRSGASFFHAQGSNEYDNKFDPLDTVLVDDFVQQVLRAHAGFAASQDLDIRLEVAQSRDESDNRKNGQPDGRFETTRNSATLQGDYQLTTAHLLTLGLDYYEDHVDASTTFEEDERANKAVFAQWQAQQNALDWQLSTRYDDNDAVGSQTTWTAAAGYWFTRAFKAYAAYGTAFKGPTFNELYFPDVGFFRGNPDLSVEESKSWELGLSGSVQAASWHFTYFRSDVKDLITYDSAQATSVNLGRAEIQGVESELTLDWEAWRGELSVTYLDAEDRDTGNELSRRPRWSGHLGASYVWERYTAGLQLLARGESYDDAANRSEMPGFGVVATSLAWTPAEHWLLKGEVLNLFDKEYEQLRGYNTDGRSYWLTLAYEH